MDYYFETRDLAVGYDGKPLIRNISIGIQKGEVVTLIGPNGAGKSTILKSITKHLQMLHGAVFIDRTSLASLNYKQLAKKVAVVLTERMSPELMSCREVVATGRYPYTGRMGILSPKDEEIVDESMRAVQVLELAEQAYNAISDGQRQRILLARALCQKPEILILDEPTSFLDIRHKLELLSVLRSLAKQEQITVIMSLHEIDLAQKVSDKIICVKGDQIDSFGSPEEIFQPEQIRELYDIDRGSFNVAFGSVELPRVEGEPEVFVVSGCGTGIPIFRQLQRERIPFAAGVLYENDLDYPVAKALAVRVISQKPFADITDDLLQKALSEMNRCRRVICTEFPIGTCNRNVQRLFQVARVHAEIQEPPQNSQSAI